MSAGGPGRAGWTPTGDARADLISQIEIDAAIAAASPSPFYEVLLGRMAEDVRAGGPTWELLERYAEEEATEFFPFRALAGVHAEVLSGDRPELAERYPSAGGDGDADSAWPLVQAAFADRDAEVLADLAHPLQTNETSRCGALVGGFCEVAAQTGMPLRVLELGASAGLNLHFDRYRYEGGGVAFGPPDSPVRFSDYWEPGTPRLDAPVEVAERRGCDLSPIDPSTAEGRLLLESCVWPDEAERFATLRAAITIAAARPVVVEAASADDWIAAQLEQASPGLATIVYHSVFWDYPPAEVRERMERTIREAGGRATNDAPLAWLSYEEGTEEPSVVELRLRTWPGGEERLLGTGRHHRHRVHWLG